MALSIADGVMTGHFVDLACGEIEPKPNAPRLKDAEFVMVSVDILNLERRRFLDNGTSRMHRRDVVEATLRLSGSGYGDHGRLL